MLVSLIIFFLNSSRFMITFVPLDHRKRIEESMRGVNMVIVEEKYFWKMYESAWNNPSSQTPIDNQSTNANSSTPTKNSTLTAAKTSIDFNK
jgi:hypothetical protein